MDALGYVQMVPWISRIRLWCCLCSDKTDKTVKKRDLRQSKCVNVVFKVSRLGAQKSLQTGCIQVERAYEKRHICWCKATIKEL